MKGLSKPGNQGGTRNPAILGRLSALADPIRCRSLLLLDQQELTVSEICSVLQLPQSTVSRHLKVLADDGWIAVRPEGTSRYYSASVGEADPQARRLWELVGDEVATSAAAEQDQARLGSVLTRRRSRSEEFFSGASEEWTGLRRELFGGAFDLRALPALLDADWTVGDLGCGTGAVSESLAPFVASVIGIDASRAMLDAARRRLSTAENVDFREARLEELPIGDDELDAATLMLVLHYSPDPQAVLTEAARAIRPDGQLLLVDMLPHDREEYRKQMGHVWLGFGRDQVDELLSASGFDRVRFHSLPPTRTPRVRASLSPALAESRAEPAKRSLPLRHIHQGDTRNDCRN